MPVKTHSVEESLGEQEREKIRTVVGSIGAKPRLKGKLLNVGFVLAVLAAFGASMVTSGIQRIVSIDIAVLILSLKLAYHLHTEARVNHAQFWILTTIEDRLLDVIRELSQLRKEIRRFTETGRDDSQGPPTDKKAGKPAHKD